METTGRTILTTGKKLRLDRVEKSSCYEGPPDFSQVWCPNHSAILPSQQNILFDKHNYFFFFKSCADHTD